MEHKELRKLSPIERQFADDNYNLITEFLRKERLDPEEFFDIVVFEFLLSVQIYLNNTELQSRCNFAACSYMYMKRAVYTHFRELKAQKRNSGNGTDESYDELEIFIGDNESFTEMEIKQAIAEIMESLTNEQQRIFLDKLEGYNLKEIAEMNNINVKRVYRQFGKIKDVVAEKMEI